MKLSLIITLEGKDYPIMPDEYPFCLFIEHNLKEDSIAVDVGAKWLGAEAPHAVLMASIVKKGEVHLFDPISTDGLIKLGGRENVTFNRVFVGNESGVKKKAKWKDISGGGSERFVLEGQEMVKAEVVKLDDLFDKIDFLKIDVEGAEWKVLQGAKELLRRSSLPPIALEFWEGDVSKEEILEMLAFLRGEGYRILQSRDGYESLIEDKSIGIGIVHAFCFSSIDQLPLKYRRFVNGS